MRRALGNAWQKFVIRFRIPLRTIQNRAENRYMLRKYVTELVERCIKRRAPYRKITVSSLHDSRKTDLPKRTDYLEAVSWLVAVSSFVGESVVFALDEAYMCQGNFGGRYNEFLIWAYGSNRLSRFKGIVILGNRISSHCVEERYGIKFTDFNRTIADALANESVLDMQGTIEALSKYYYTNGESFEGISVPQKYRKQFECLARDAVEYYNDGVDFFTESKI